MDLWVVEYSPVQQCFHIDTLDRVLELNREAVLAGRNPGYIPLALCNSNDEAKAFVAQWKKGRAMTERNRVIIQQLREGC